jgi:predicted phosphodiesterase
MASRVAVLSDVHANAVALDAVLSDVGRMKIDLIVFGGDLTWGPEPEATLAILERLDLPALFVRGNAERLLLDYVGRIERGEPFEPTPREEWLVGLHRQLATEFLASFVEQAVFEVDGLGPVRVCHGSPRSDEELITPKTPAKRIRQLAAGISERVLVSAHTHLQFDRVVGGLRSVNAGSVGMPYGGAPGAYWATLGPDVELRHSTYDIADAARRYRASVDPHGRRMAELLLNPPTAAEIIEEAERLEFSG